MATIRQRGTKYQVQIRRNGQRQLTKTFNLRRDAIAWARQMEVQADRNDLPMDGSILKQLTVRDLVVRYRTSVTSRKRNRDWEEICLGAFLRHPICNKTLACVSAFILRFHNRTPARTKMYALAEDPNRKRALLHETQVILFRADNRPPHHVLAVNDYGWGDCLGVPVAVHALEGDHMGILRLPCVHEIASELNRVALTN